MCYSSLGTVGYRRGVDIVAKQWKPHTEGEFSQPQLTPLRSIEQRAKKKSQLETLPFHAGAWKQISMPV